jgi:hypothetical protein
MPEAGPGRPQLTMRVKIAVMRRIDNRILTGATETCFIGNQSRILR